MTDVLSDLLQHSLRIVLCGTAAGTTSAAERAYYAHRQNKFWKILHETRLTPEQLQPHQYRSLLQHGIGLTDLVKRDSGSDRDLRFTPVDALILRTKVMLHQPRYLCFNGKRAAQEFLGASSVEYGVQPIRLGRTVLFVAPSTSAAANGSWDASVWRDLARRVCRSRGRSGRRRRPQSPQLGR